MIVSITFKNNYGAYIFTREFHLYEFDVFAHCQRIYTSSCANGILRLLFFNIHTGNRRYWLLSDSPVFVSYINVEIQQQQNPKFLLCATRQAPEDHGGALRCVLPTPHPFVVFPVGQQGAPTYLVPQDLEPIFGLESIVHSGAL